MTRKLDSIEYWKCQFNIYHTEGSWVPLKRLVIWRRYFVKQSVHCISHANAWCEYWQRMKRIWRVWSADMWTRTIVNEMAKKWHTWNMWREWWRLLSCDWLDERMSVGRRLKKWNQSTTKLIETCDRWKVRLSVMTLFVLSIVSQSTAHSRWTYPT